VNIIEALQKLKRSRGHNRQLLMLHWGLKTRTRRWLWEADHIIAVVEGEGECDLENIQTLCLRCHCKKTKQLRERRRLSSLSEEAMAMRDVVPSP